ncbi:MAG TPA: GNAT family N-acetyltransferase [Longimicrobiales bacterium]|nr:GNAT family N-acetyltransferase [Longimicrobiales bacterium]
MRAATDADGPALLELVGGSESGNGVRWRIERTADFFALFRGEGGRWKVLVAEEAGTGSLVGCLTVVAREAYVHDRTRRTCYVSNFLVRSDRRGRGIGDALCRHAAEFCREVVGDDGLVLLVVRRGNQQMGRRAVGPRGLPPLRPFATLAVHSISTQRVRESSALPHRGIRAANDADVEEMAELAERVYRRRQFAPTVDVERMRQWIAAAPGITPADCLVAREGGAVVGWLAVWDESAVRRVRVAGYSRIAAARYALRDRLRFLTQAPPSPRVGEVVGCSYAVRVCVPSTRPDVLELLLVRASKRLAEAGCAWLKIALDERDDLAAALPRLTTRKVALDALVATPTGAYSGPGLADRPLHFEVALA